MKEIDSTWGIVSQNDGSINTKRSGCQQFASELIEKLNDKQFLKAPTKLLSVDDINEICHLVTERFTNETVCLKFTLAEPLNIVGDILGHYGQLRQLFDGIGHPPEQRYLFLGNYADIGTLGLDTLVLLFVYKILYPQCVYLLRGKHECVTVGRNYGLRDQCIRHFNERLWHSICTSFTCMPVAAVIEDSVFCMHSGLSPLLSLFDWLSLQEFQNLLEVMIPRPAFMKPNSLLAHILWSEPDPLSSGWEQNPAGLGYLFGPNEVSAFCKKTGVVQIIRSGSVVTEGFEFFENPKLLTIFSIPDFCSLYGNAGAVVQLAKNAEQVQLFIRKVQSELCMRRGTVTRIRIDLEGIGYEMGTGVVQPVAV